MAGLTLAGTSLATNSLSSIKNVRPIHVFTKCLQFLNYEEMAQTLAKNGFDGADLTVRPGGQVLPENVERDLPKVHKALKNAGVGTNMITTGLSDPSDPAFKPTLKTMADLGIKYYRIGYINYDNKLSMPQNLENIK